MASGFNRENLLKIISKNDNDLIESSTENEEEYEESSDYLESTTITEESMVVRSKKKKTDDDEVARYQRKLGLSSKSVASSSEEMIVKRKPTFIEEEEEKQVFDYAIYPSMVIEGKKKLKADKSLIDGDTTKNNNTSDNFNTISFTNLISDFSKDLSLKKANSIVKKLQRDISYEEKQKSKRKKYNIYRDLKEFNSLEIFSKRWKNVILMDPNVEIPFIYLQSLESGGLGALKYDFKANIMMLEALGMTVQVVNEIAECCRYRAFFSGKVPEIKSSEEDNIIQNIIDERKLDRRYNEKHKKGGVSNNNIDTLIERQTEKTDLHKSERDRLMDLKKAQKRIDDIESETVYNLNPVNISEKAKEKKKKKNILNIEKAMKSDFLDEEEELEDDEPNQQVVDEYDSYLNGFTKNMINALSKNCKFINEKTVDAIARKSTEISAWIENYLCIDICVIPGLNIEKKKVERQLVFMFNVQTQNPFTFLVRNRLESYKKE